MDEGEIVSRKPVAARRHTTTLFDPVEEPFDLVASAIKLRAEADRIAAISFRGDVGPRPLFRGVDHLDSGIVGSSTCVYDVGLIHFGH